MTPNKTITTHETRAHTILLVEDSQAVAELICWLLQENGFKTQLATTVKQGLAMAVTQPPALALLDVDLPDGTGFSLCRQMKAHPMTFHVPVIFCTGRPDARSEALAAGAVDCVQKPVDVSELPARIQRALDQLSSAPKPNHDSKH